MAQRIKRIGLYLSAHPHEGGTYQYNLSMIDALRALPTDEYRITAYYLVPSWQNILPKEWTHRCVARTFLHKVLNRFYKMLDTSQESWRRFPALFNPIIRTINRDRCDVVLYPSQDAVAYQTSVKSLVAVHDLMHRYESHFEEYRTGDYAYEVRERHYSNITKYADGIMVDSTIGKEQVVESYQCSTDKVHVLPFVPPTYLLESQEIDMCAKYRLPQRFIFYPAQFWEHKNHTTLLQALYLLREQGETIPLVLVGSKKNNYDRVVQALADLRLQEHVHILGYVSNDEMYSLYKQAVAMVFVSCAGPTNIPPIEALLLGCPLIVSNKYAMPEQVGSAALLVDPLSPEEFAQNILHIWHSCYLREQLKQSGFHQIQSWTQKHFNERVKTIIDHVIEK